MKRIKLFLAGLMIFPAMAWAQIVPAPPAAGGDSNSYNGPLVNAPTGAAYSNTYALDLAKYDSSKVSAQVLYSSVTYTSPTFSDGTESTGNVTVISYARLSSATASNYLTVNANNWPLGAILNVNGTQLVGGVNWAKGNVSSNTATNIAAAIVAGVSGITASASGSVVYATATVYGTAGNVYFMTSNTSSITVNALKFSGGQDNAVLTINGVTLTANSQFYPLTSNAVTATRIAAAINAHASLSPTLISTAPAGSAIIYATSTLNGTAYNYTLTTSTPGSLSVSGAVMTGGTNPGDVLNSRVITAVSTFGLPLALPVLYTGTPAIGGLTTGTTYFAVPLAGNTFSLAKYSTSAVAGLTADYVLVTSTNSGTTAHTYTLAPLGWSGSASFVWQSSNDNSNWATLPLTSAVTVTSTTASTDALYDFGFYNFRYIRLSYTAPTTGALNLVVPVNIKQDGIGRY